MNLKRVFAGVAAAATMLGGLALGATTANAADGDQTITINNPQAGHTYTAYRFATFDNPQNMTENGKDVSYVDVNTVPEMKNAVATAAGSVPKPYTSNPAAYVATLPPAQLRTFANSLTEQIEGMNPKPTSYTPAENGIFTLPEGWYAILDTQNGTATPTATAIVATAVNGATHLTVNGISPEANIEAPGSYNVKSANAAAPMNVKKQVKLSTADDSTLSNNADIHDGAQVTYVVSAEIPAAAAGYTNYKFTFVDEAASGLTIAAAPESVTAGEDKVPQTAADGEPYYEFVAQGTNGAKNSTLTIYNAQKYAGKTITLTYNATAAFGDVNSLQNTVNSFAYLDGAAEGQQGTVASGYSNTATVKTHDVTFTKVGVGSDAAGLEGAQFAIKNADGKYGTYANNTWTWDAETASLAATSARNGEVSFLNLAAGTYTVEEIKAPAGYAQNLLPSFQITVGTDDTVTLDNAGNTLGLASTVGKVIQVQNVKSVTQLPLTGAAGITMLVVVALLLGGAGALIAVRSRSLKRQLNA
ncbi:fimbrial subunit-like cell surface protein [Bifidobacterium pseudolongum subsp. globosum]|uniref:SpaA isopeptide-forming pilin-related protein n=1 Tax=Bifidobacterium pseudolongum TaxID=1694 RepID=UPI0010209D89|nr:SpaA isopeptide-forming pilin-related protein [Bifidobacterium pseudolongum]RYQ41295.1 fimbrial subunit-like cell surface protein [Bifidobacterium pseudolongum subsp. globosum]